MIDYAGAFEVTTGHGMEALVAEFAAQHDDFGSIMAKALADRLAEAFAEHLHARVRREFWGYAAAESLDSEGLIKDKYQSILSALGDPACPDHRENGTLFAMAEVANGRAWS